MSTLRSDARFDARSGPGSDRINLAIGSSSQGRYGTCSDEISIVEFDPGECALRLVSAGSDAANPMYIASFSDCPRIAVSHEGDPSAISLWQVCASTDELTRLHTLHLAQADSCHITVVDDRWLWAAHYSSSAVSVHEVVGDRISEAIAEFALTASTSLHPRQERAHPHQTLFQNGIVYVPDLGTDLVHRFAFDRKTGSADPIPPLQTETLSGIGLRHGVFVGNALWLSAELAGMLVGFADPVDPASGYVSVPTSTDQDFLRRATVACSAVRRWGIQRVLVANRGPNTLAAFTVEDESRPQMLWESSVAGQHPRDVYVSQDDEWVFVANQASDEITVFRPELSGLGPPVASLRIPSPTSIVQLRLA